MLSFPTSAIRMGVVPVRYLEIDREPFQDKIITCDDPTCFICVDETENLVS